MVATATAVSRQQTINGLISRFGETNACRGINITIGTLKTGCLLFVESLLENEVLSLRIDALKRTNGTSNLGDYHYVPMLHIHGNMQGLQAKLWLAVVGLALGRLQGLLPVFGFVIRTPDARLGKVPLDSKLYRHAEQVLDEIKQLNEPGELPRLALNSPPREDPISINVF